MPNRTADTLYQLVKSLHQAEKRNFKLYAKRNFSNKDLQTLQLFDALDKLNTYDEKALLKKTTIWFIRRRLRRFILLTSKGIQST